MERRSFLAFAAALAILPGAASAEEKKTGSGSYIQINTISGTTTRAGGRRGILTVECGLDIPDDKLRQQANLSLPRLRAAFVQTVQVYAAGLPAGAAPSVEFIGRELQRQTNTVLGRPGARLLLGAVVVN
jgi:hypothetical protein